MTDTVSTALAVLAIIVQVLLAGIAVLALAALVAPGARPILREVRDTLLGGELWAAWAVALVATAGSLYFSEVADFVPCRLCWMQRIFMYPLALLLLAMAVRRDIRNALLYALPLPVIGIAISGYHIYIERNPEAESQSCRAGVPCSTKWIEEFGYVTLPTLAATAFAAIIVLLVFAHSRARYLRPAP